MPRPIHLGEPESIRLQAALLAIYRTPGAFDGGLGRVGQSYPQLETGSLTYEQNVLAIVRQGAAAGWIMDLIAKTLVAVPDPELQAIQRELLLRVPVPSVDLFQVCRLTGRNVMVDRADLRKFLRSMVNPGGSRLLVVKGPRRSGRTHTVQLLSYLQQQRGGFTLRRIDLETVTRMSGVPVSDATNTSPIQIFTSRPHGLTSGSSVYVDGVTGNRAANGLWSVRVTGAAAFELNGSVGSGDYASGGIAKLQTPVEAWHIAEKLLNLLRYDVKELPEAPTDAQWAHWVYTFCDIFEGCALLQESQRLERNPPPPQEQVWIVIDTFHAVLLAQSSVDLIRELANRIATTLHHFRMVLLGFEDSLPGQVVNHLEEEKIGQIGEKEIIEFVGRALNQMQISFDEDRVVEIVESVLKEVDLHDPEFLSKLGPVASRELGKVENGN